MVGESAIAHGFHDNDMFSRNRKKRYYNLEDYLEINHPRFCELLMLIVSEAGEACEAIRNNDAENFQEELADIVIRVMDLCYYFGIDLEEEILKKHAKKMQT